MSKDRLTWLAAAAVFVVLALSAVWTARDDFLSREEAQHVLRALLYEQDLEAALQGRGSWRALVVHPPSAPKSHYGFPYYLPIAGLWSVAGVGLDRAVALNVAWLLLLLFGGGLLAASLAEDRGAAVPAALALSTFPGILIYVHILGPDIFAAASVAWGAALLLRLAARPSPARALLAGLGTGFVLVVKPSNLAFLLVPLLFSALRVRRRLTLPAALAFAGGLAPALAWLPAERAVAATWSPLLRGLSLSIPMHWQLARSFRDGGFVILPFTLLLLVAATIRLAPGAFPQDRHRLAFLLAWIVLPPALLCLTTGFVLTPHNHLPVLVPISTLLALAARRLSERQRNGAGCLLLVHATAYGLVALLGVGPEAFREALAWPWSRATIERELVRTLPERDLLSPVLRDLERIVPGDAPSRCGCLPFPPYPVTEGRALPVVLVDGQAAGPENLNAWLRVRPGFRPRVFGYVPYGLAGTPYKTALDCASLVVVKRALQERWEPVLERLRAQKRPELEAWMASGAMERIGPFEDLLARRPELPGLCQTPSREWPARVAALLAPGAHDYYGLHLEALALRQAGGAAAPLVAESRRLAALRVRELEAVEAAPARVFGEYEALAVPIARGALPGR